MDPRTCTAVDERDVLRGGYVPRGCSSRGGRHLLVDARRSHFVASAAFDGVFAIARRRGGDSAASATPQPPPPRATPQPPLPLPPRKSRYSSWRSIFCLIVRASSSGDAIRRPSGRPRVEPTRRIDGGHEHGRARVAATPLGGRGGGGAGGTTCLHGGGVGASLRLRLASRGESLALFLLALGFGFFAAASLAERSAFFRSSADLRLRHAEGISSPHLSGSRVPFSRSRSVNIIRPDAISSST